jgi:hypothetical protein
LEELIGKVLKKVAVSLELLQCMIAGLFLICGSGDLAKNRISNPASIITSRMRC